LIKSDWKLYYESIIILDLKTGAIMKKIYVFLLLVLFSCETHTTPKKKPVFEKIIVKKPKKKKTKIIKSKGTKPKSIIKKKIDILPGENYQLGEKLRFVSLEIMNNKLNKKISLILSKKERDNDFVKYFTFKDGVIFYKKYKYGIDLKNIKKKNILEYISKYVKDLDVLYTSGEIICNPKVINKINSLNKNKLYLNVSFKKGIYLKCINKIKVKKLYLSLKNKIDLVYLNNKNLVGLNVSDYKLKNLKSLKKFKNLKILGIGNLEFQSNYLVELAQLHNLNLEVLEFPYSSINNSALKIISKFQNLKELVLSGRKINNLGIKSLLKLKNLTKLDIRDTQINKKGCKKLTKLQNIKEFKYGYGQCEIKNLNKFKKLTHLTAIQSIKRNKDLKGIEKLKNLRYLNISLYDIDTNKEPYLNKISIIKKLGKLKNLEFLNSSRILMKDYSWLKDLKKLRYVKICQMDNEILNILTSHKNLECFESDLQALREVNHKEYENLLKNTIFNMKNLKGFYIHLYFGKKMEKVINKKYVKSVWVDFPHD
jgi:hypothetical protein